MSRAKVLEAVDSFNAAYGVNLRVKSKTLGYIVTAVQKVVDTQEPVKTLPIEVRKVLEEKGVVFSNEEPEAMDEEKRIEALLEAIEDGLEEIEMLVAMRIEYNTLVENSSFVVTPEEEALVKKINALKAAGKAKKVAKARDALRALQVEEEPEVAVKEEPSKKPKATKKVGVIRSILNILEEAEGELEFDEILDTMSELFPERDPASMRKTLQVQIGSKNRPCRLEREKEVVIQFEKRDGKKFFRLVKEA